MRDRRKLEVYRMSMDLVERVYRLTQKYPSEERFGLTSQMRRAAVSIPSNLAEGCARAGDAEFARFVNIAYASCQELIVQLEIASRLGLLSVHAADPAENLHGMAVQLADRVGSALYSLWNNASGSGSSSGRPPTPDPRPPRAAIDGEARSIDEASSVERAP